MDLDDPRVGRYTRPMPEDFQIVTALTDYGMVVAEHVLPNGATVRLGYYRGSWPDEDDLREGLRNSVWRLAEAARIGADLPAEWTGAVN